MTYDDFFKDIVAIKEISRKHGMLLAIDANLPDGTPVRIMQNSDDMNYYHVSVDPIPSIPPEPVHESQVIPEIMRQWLGE